MKKGKLVLICGDDEFLVEGAARERVNQLVPEAERAFGIEVVDGRCDTGDEVVRAVEACVESVRTPGFLGSSKVTWLRHARFLTGGGRVSESVAAKGAVERLTGWLKEGLLDGQALIITAEKVLRSSLFFKTCQQQGEVVDFGGGLKSWELERQAQERLERLLEAAGLSMDDEARQEFLTRVGFDTRLQVQELEKLGLYLGAVKHATAEAVREITSIGREAEAWDVLDAVGNRDAVALVGTLRRLGGQRGVGIKLAAMLEKNIRELLVLREAYDRKWVYGGKGGACGWSNSLPPEAAAVLAVLPVNPKTLQAWAMRRRLPHALNYTLQELRVARFRILELREKLVSTGLPELLLVETALLRIIGRPRAPAARAAAGAR